MPSFGCQSVGSDINLDHNAERIFSMPGTLLFLFHPDLTKSKANAALRRAAAVLPYVEIVDVQSEHPDGKIDVFGDTDADVSRLLSADRVVLQFPVQWYSVPPIMKSWLDAVLTRMYYIKAEDEGGKLEGTPLMIAATAGNVPEAYGPDGGNGYPMSEILTPLKATAFRCKLPLAEPFLVYRANKLDDDGLEAEGERYATTLGEWIEETKAAAAA